MKRILGAAFGMFVFLEIVIGLSAATYQPTRLGWVVFSTSSGTFTEIEMSTPPTVGYQRYCTNCGGGGGKGTICVSTSTTGGTVSGSYFIIQGTGPICR